MPQRPNQSIPKWFVSLNTHAQNQIKKKFALLVIILEQERSCGTCQHQDNFEGGTQKRKKKERKEGMLCASFKIKGWVKIVDELKRLKRVNTHTHTHIYIYIYIYIYIKMATH